MYESNEKEILEDLTLPEEDGQLVIDYDGFCMIVDDQYNSQEIDYGESLLMKETCKHLMNGEFDQITPNANDNEFAEHLAKVLETIHQAGGYSEKQPSSTY